MFEDCEGEGRAGDAAADYDDCVFWGGHCGWVGLLGGGSGREEVL